MDFTGFGEMNPYAILGILLAFAALGCWATYEDGQASKWEGKYNTLQASYATAAASAITHAQAVSAKEKAANQKQGAQALASAATKQTAIKVYYKTVYLPSLTKLDPKDEASKCANLAVPDSVLTSLSASPGH